MWFSTRIRRFFVARPPAASIEIAADRVTGVSLGRARSGTVTAVVTERLPDGALVPSPNATNVIDHAGVTEAVLRVLTRLPAAVGRVSLVVPDSAAKVSLMTFAQVPARTADWDQLVRWQARKTTPFRVEEAQVACTEGADAGGEGREFIVRLMRRDIVQEYEAVCSAAGGHAGIIDLASLSQINAILAGETDTTGDCLLVHVAHGYSTLAVIRNGVLILFRSRSSGGEETLADLVHQTTMYYEDRLQGGGFQRAFLAASTANTTKEDAAVLRESLEVRLGTVVEPLTLRRSDVDSAGEPHLPDLIAAPLGLLLREQVGSGIRG